MNDVKSNLPFEYPLRDPKRYQASKTQSFYLTSYDGTKIAVDVTLPQVPEDERVPAVIMVTRDHRRMMQDFEVSQGIHFVEAGFAHIIVELRGCGVSYGINHSFCDERHCRDLLSVVNWAAQQSWCSGKIGIYGGSNRAFIQLCTGALNPKNITAINPVVAVQDFYYQNYPNGVSACPNIHIPKPPVIMDKETFLTYATPVDEDPNGDMAYEAFSRDQWPNNMNFFETLFLPSMNRDSEHPLYHNEKTNMTIPPYGKLDAFYKTGVKQHQYVGELESGTLGQMALFLDYGGTVCLGPWAHEGALQGRSPFPNGDFSVPEAYSYWYDYALKGKDNGFDQAPPVSYYVINAPKGKEWRFSESWPPENEARTVFYLSNAKSGTSASCNDGTLVQTKPEVPDSVNYQVRDDIVVFPDENGKARFNRSELYWGGDMEPSVDSKGLTFTSAPLFPLYQNEFAGCISANLWISCDQRDVDLVVYAEEVFSDGTSHYIKDGVMRASHRTTGSNPSWEEMGAFWHTSMTEDVNRCLAEGLDKPTLLQFAVDPTCYHFRGGSRLRFTVTCANKAAFQHTMYGETLPTLTLYTGGEYASTISVPFLEQVYQASSGTCGGNDAALYRFEKNSYLCTGGRWYRFASSDLHTVEGEELLLPNGLRFHQYGAPELYPTANLTRGNPTDSHPVPRFSRNLVDIQPVSQRDYTLFVPSSKRLYLDVFSKEACKKSPCIFFVHGYSSPYNYLPNQLRMMYADGYAIAALDVRNYPPNEFPDYIHDAKGAIRYLRAHAEEFGVDPERIGIYGYSLGGNTSLMIALTGDDPALEGTVGGNHGYSSRVQAAACGFAWSDLLNMGADIGTEEASSPAMTARRIELTDGEFAPSCEVIGFSGKGKGLKVLREYAQGDTRDDLMEEKLQQARYASPISHVTPAAPPIALFGGYGDDGVNIAFKQCMRTFVALESVGTLAFLYGNTHGKYGENEEVTLGIKAFFDRQLAAEKPNTKLVITEGSSCLVENSVSRKLPGGAYSDGKGLWLNGDSLLPYLSTVKQLDYTERDGDINILTLTGSGLQVKYYASHNTTVITF